MEKPIVSSLLLLRIPWRPTLGGSVASDLLALAPPSDSGFEQPAENASENNAMRKVERRIKVTSA